MPQSVPSGRSFTWEELMETAKQAKKLVESWPEWKKEVSREALSREFYYPTSNSVARGSESGVADVDD